MTVRAGTSTREPESDRDDRHRRRGRPGLGSAGRGVGSRSPERPDVGEELREAVAELLPGVEQPGRDEPRLGVEPRARRDRGRRSPCHGPIPNRCGSRSGCSRRCRRRACGSRTARAVPFRRGGPRPLMRRPRRAHRCQGRGPCWSRRRRRPGRGRRWPWRGSGRRPPDPEALSHPGRSPSAHAVNVEARVSSPLPSPSEPTARSRSAAPAAASTAYAWASTSAIGACATTRRGSASSRRSPSTPG